jgi:hypothetical protein
MHGKAKLPVSSAEGPHGGHRMAMIGDPRARASWSFAVQEFAKAHHLSPEGRSVVRTASPHSSCDPEHMKRTLVVNGERR